MDGGGSCPIEPVAIRCVGCADGAGVSGFTGVIAGEEGAGNVPLLIPGWKGVNPTGVMPARGENCPSVRTVGESVSSGEPGSWFTFPGVMTVEYSAASSRPNSRVSVSMREDTVGKRAVGSLARQRMMIAVSGGGRLGLISAGEMGVALRCCIIIVAGLFPVKGGVPVQIS